jgi:hypothetical protein
MLTGIANTSEAGLGDPIYVANNGSVALRFLGYEAAYTNTLWLHSPVTSGPIFVNKTTPVDTVFDLGVFAAGTPLAFRIVVDNLGIVIPYFSGPASLNADDEPHALVDWFPGNVANIGFEDLWNGGDRDYNDLRFSVTNVSKYIVSEPASLMLLGLGVAGLWLSRARIRP